MERFERVPSAEEINALPHRSRHYIHDLETRCDASGDVRELGIARETCIALEARHAETLAAVQPLLDAAKAVGLIYIDIDEVIKLRDAAAVLEALLAKE